MFRNVNPVELARGQTVIVYARWLLVLAGLLVTVWNPDGLGQLRLQIGVVLAVAIGNFVMHAQLLRKRQTFQSVAFMASVGDLAMIALLVLSQGGFGSTTFVFFFPAVLAIALAFPTEEAVLLSGIAVILEVVVSANSRDVDVTLVRAGALAATAVIGNAYWRLHRTNIVATANRAREAAQDLFWGQSATLWARWAMIAGGALLILSRADTTERLAIGVLPVVLLLISNFYLHGRYLLERPANAVLTLLATSLDLFAMVAMYFTWPGAIGLNDPVFVLLYPLVLGVGLVFQPRISWAFTGAALTTYAALILTASNQDPKTLVVRLITIAAMGGLGSLYWRIVRRPQPSTSGATDEAVSPLAWQPARAS
jgi:hypothetical protein